MGIFEGLELVTTVHPFTATFPDRLRLAGPAADKVRELLDQWVEAECGDDADEVGGRLLNRRDPIGSVATFYELLTGRALRKLFGNAEWEPQGLPCSGDPDWAAMVGQQRVVFEVRSLEEDMPEDERRGQALFRRLADINAPWFVSVRWDQCEGLASARIGQLAKLIEQRLAQLQPGTGPHDIAVEHGDARVVITAGPMPKARSIIQSKTRVEWAPGIESIRSAVKKKGSKYAGLKAAGVPYVVVVCTEHPLLDADSLCTALFGDEVIKVMLRPGQPPVVAGRVLNETGCLTPTGGGQLNLTPWPGEPGELQSVTGAGGPGGDRWRSGPSGGITPSAERRRRPRRSRSCTRRSTR